tara:strand:- start:3725 stop:3892 length:168 start_codon:yes stop_codon:yes gene_type:complete
LIQPTNPFLPFVIYIGFHSFAGYLRLNEREVGEHKLNIKLDYASLPESYYQGEKP